jgi:hypothetical protein
MNEWQPRKYSGPINANRSNTNFKEKTEIINSKVRIENEGFQSPIKNEEN